MKSWIYWSDSANTQVNYIFFLLNRHRIEKFPSGNDLPDISKLLQKDYDSDKLSEGDRWADVVNTPADLERSVAGEIDETGVEMGNVQSRRILECKEKTVDAESVERNRLVK